MASTLVLLAVVILGIGGVAIGAGMTTTVLASDIHRKQSTAGMTVRAYAEAIEHEIIGHGSYRSCARPGDYSVICELRVIADVDQRRAAAHGVTRGSGVEPGQPVAGVGE